MSLLHALRTLLLLSAVVAWAGPVYAHGGEDHSAQAVAAPQSNTPRAFATSENYEIVAVLKDGHLLIYVDRFDDNSPVTGAELTITADGQQIKAKPTPEGVYMIDAGALEKPGRHELVFELKDGAAGDLLIGTLEVPRELASTSVAPQGISLLSRIESAPSGAGDAFLNLTPAQTSISLGSVAVLGMLVLLLRRRRTANSKAAQSISQEPAGHHADDSESDGVAKLRAKSAGRAAAAAVLLALIVAYAPKAMAHGDEDHGDAKSPVAVSGDAPRRLPDASVFLSKPTQRLIEVRTVQAMETSTQPSRSLAGRVIADPDRFGVVQSTLGGRITPAAGGLPKLGQAVKAGEVLGYVAPYIAAIDRSDAAQTAGNLDQEIALAETRLARAKRLFAVNAGTGVQVEERQIELEGLRKRRAAIALSTTKPEPLVAPIDGVIAATKGVAGQVVEPKDILFEIIDPSSLWVEAFAFDQSAPQSYSGASATTQDGSSFKLAFIGRSRALRQQSTVLQFAIENPPVSLNVGMPVTVLVQEGDPVKGIVLPKTAIVRAANGEDVVWQHEEPERFVATAVKVSSFDGDRVLVRGGMKSGGRVVVQGAELINQVR